VPTSISSRRWSLKLDRRVWGYLRAHGEGVPLIIELALPAEAIGQDSGRSDLISRCLILAPEDADLHVREEAQPATREHLGYHLQIGHRFSAVLSVPEFYGKVAKLQ
jgi:hypothetical protein